MISVDTNILLSASVPENPNHAAAIAFVRSLDASENVAISELVLVELYVLLRNQMVVKHPMSPEKAAALCQRLRNHPKWLLLGYANDSRGVHDELWRKVAEPAFARRRIYDLRMGLTLVRQGVKEFATVNVKDFADAGFKRVWNPLQTHP